MRENDDDDDNGANNQFLVFTPLSLGWFVPQQQTSGTGLRQTSWCDLSFPFQSVVTAEENFNELIQPYLINMSEISQPAPHVLGWTCGIPYFTKSAASKPKCHTPPLAFAGEGTVLEKQDSQQLMEDHPARAGL